MDQGKIAEKGLRLLFFPLGGYRPSYTSSDPLSAGGLHRSKNKYSLDKPTIFTQFRLVLDTMGWLPPVATHLDTAFVPLHSTGLHTSLRIHSGLYGGTTLACLTPCHSSATCCLLTRFSVAVGRWSALTKHIAGGCTRGPCHSILVPSVSHTLLLPRSYFLRKSRPYKISNFPLRKSEKFLTNF